jgi:DNA repair protein RadD
MLRSYQKEAIDGLRKEIRNGKTRIGLLLPTGAGKTYIAKQIIDGALQKHKRIIFVADRIELIDQTSETLDAHGIDHGVMQADHWRTNYAKPVQVCSVQTLARRQWPDFDICIVDEFHSMYSAQLKMMAEQKHLIYIGLSATPYTKGLGNHWQSLVVGATTKDLIDQGYLSDFVVYAPPPPNLKGVPISGGDWSTKKLAERVDRTAPVGDVIRTWKRYGNNNRTICFAVNIEHSRHICQKFQDVGVNAVHIDAYTDKLERKNIIQKYKEGEIKILSCVDVLTKGFDDNMTNTLIMARPTKSLITHIQQIGRALRVSPEKEDAIILDHGGNVERHGFPTDESLPVTLCTKEKGEKKEQATPEKKPKSCPKCHFVKPVGVYACPKCGHEPSRVNTVEHEKGELVKITRASMADKQEWYSMLLGYAKNKQYAQGWASHKYREKYGVWPKGLNHIAKEPNKDVLGYITHLNIKYANRRSKNERGQSNSRSHRRS